MKKKLLTALAFLPFIVSAQVKQADLTQFVNPLMGSDSKPSLSNGNTYPAIALPWGMNFWTPQTGKMGSGWQYTYNADKVVGFKQTHQPSPWMNDYGEFSLFPETGKIKLDEASRASWFSHKAEISKPYYYSVYLADYDVTTEITPTTRAANFRISFPKSDSSHIVIDAYDKGSYIKIIPSKREIVGYSTRNSGSVTENFKNYFVIYIDKQFESASAWHDAKIIDEGSLEYKGDHAGAVVSFKTSSGEKIHLKVASSFISFEQAELNLEREIGKDNFEATRIKAKDTWNKTLNHINIEGGSIDQERTFYSCLYRMLFFPNRMYEVNAKGETVHYSPYNGKVMPGYLFAGTGFWDTFRALYPFLNFVYPSMVKEMQEGLINDYKEGGWLPEWSSPGYADCMIGNNSASIVAEAYLKGGRGYDIEKLYEALIHGANHEGPNATGRKGVEYYNKIGYVPYNVGINENAARTLEYAYDDFAIYQLGKALGKPESEIAIYKKRSQNYRNLFDPQTGLMRGKNQDGSLETPFNPFKWGDAFTEGNSWHYTWGVFQDIQGLINLMGGRQKFVAKLDSVFILPPVFDDSYYKTVIHEIREMQIANMGQYAHGNQPIQHMIYLYGYGQEPWKTQYWARETMNRMYRATPDGYCGDEDNGQTSAWYVFSAMGFYPVCPVSCQYVLGAPLFKKMAINLENGRVIHINAPANSTENRYIKTMTYDGKSYTKNWLSHQDLMKGAELNFDMSPVPNKQRGVKTDDVPFSESKPQ